VIGNWRAGFGPSVLSFLLSGMAVAVAGPPVAVNDQYVAPAGGNLSVDWEVGVLANDTSVAVEDGGIELNVRHVPHERSRLSRYSDLALKSNRGSGPATKTRCLAGYRRDVVLESGRGPRHPGEAPRPLQRCRQRVAAWISYQL